MTERYRKGTTKIMSSLKFCALFLALVFASVSISASYFSQDWEVGETRWDGSRQNADTCFGALHRYVGFGDSLTWGWTADYWDSHGGYGPRLQEMLRGICPEAVVILRGYGGERTCDGVERIDSVLAEEAPEYLLILEGVNDIQAAIRSEIIFLNLQEMVRKTKAYGSIPVLGTLPPRRDCWYMSSWSEDLNRDYIRPFAKQERVLLADHWKFFNEKPDWRQYIDDWGQHPNAAGYDLMAECWFVALEEDPPPAGLTAAAGGEVVRLSWDANSETGLAGYNVYMRLSSMDGYEKLNGDLLTETVYEGMKAASGSCIYAVTAVDRCGNESEYSDEVMVNWDNGDCFIASAAYGALTGEVEVLRRLRDGVLLKSCPGRALVRSYYRLSPPAARFISKRDFAKALVRTQLKPAVLLARLLLRSLPR